MFRVRDIEREYSVLVGNGLQPVMASEDGYAAILSFERTDKPNVRRIGIDATQEIKTALEGVDVDAFPIRQQARLAGELVLFAAGAGLERDGLLEFEVAEPPDLNPLRGSGFIVLVHVGGRRNGNVELGKRQHGVREYAVGGDGRVGSAAGFDELAALGHLNQSAGRVLTAVLKCREHVAIGQAQIGMRMVESADFGVGREDARVQW